MNGRLFAKLAGMVNDIAAFFGVHIMRVATLQKLIETKTEIETIPIEPLVLSQCSHEPSDENRLALESRVAKLESFLESNSIENVIRYAMKAHWRTVNMIDQLSGNDKPDSSLLCGTSTSENQFDEISSECIFGGGRLLRHQCKNCDVIFGPQKMLALDDEMLDLDYRNLYRIYSEGDSTESVIRTFHLLRPKKSGVYLDFGCGGDWSKALDQLRGEGWNIYGFEPSVSNTSETVLFSWEDIESMEFDGIISHNVLEHLFDPVGTTQRLSNLLLEGGQLIHATARFDYKYEYSHYHVYFFTGRSPEILAYRSGMKILDWVRDGEYIACTMGKLH